MNSPEELEKIKTGDRKKRRPGHNLLRRFRDFKADVLRFAYDFATPFTNNLAEQDIRMMKLRMKISGGFRSKKKARKFSPPCARSFPPPENTAGISSTPCRPPPPA